VFWFRFNAYVLNTKGPSRHSGRTLVTQDNGCPSGVHQPGATMHVPRQPAFAKSIYPNSHSASTHGGPLSDWVFIIDVFSTRSMLYVTDALRTLRDLSILSAKGTFLHGIVPLIHTYKDASLNCG